LGTCGEILFDATQRSRGQRERTPFPNRRNTMDPNTTALVLVGMQKDWFHPEGNLRPLIESEVRERNMLNNALAMLEAASSTDLHIIVAPTLFQQGYPELIDPVGVLAAIRDAGALQEGTLGGELVDEIQAMGDRVRVMPGKHGMNAFIDTGLEETLRSLGVTTVALAGVATSLCIDTTARTAYELGFRVKIVTDCIAGRTPIEDQVYCEEIFPMYADLVTSEELLSSVNAAIGTA
jgi:nicotinamidase-related amidase